MSSLRRQIHQQANLSAGDERTMLSTREREQGGRGEDGLQYGCERGKVTSSGSWWIEGNPFGLPNPPPRRQVARSEAQSAFSLQIAQQELVSFESHLGRCRAYHAVQSTLTCAIRVTAHAPRRRGRPSARSDCGRGSGESPPSLRFHRRQSSLTNAHPTQSPQPPKLYPYNPPPIHPLYFAWLRQRLRPPRRSARCLSRRRAGRMTSPVARTTREEQQERRRSVSEAAREMSTSQGSLSEYIIQLQGKQKGPTDGGVRGGGLWGARAWSGRPLPCSSLAHLLASAEQQP